MYFCYMNFFKNSFHLIVSLLLIFNQLGFDFNLHYCGDSFSSISFLNQSKNCGMHQEEVDKSNNDKYILIFSAISKIWAPQSFNGIKEGTNAFDTVIDINIHRIWMIFWRIFCTILKRVSNPFEWFKNNSNAMHIIIYNQSKILVPHSMAS